MQDMKLNVSEFGALFARGTMHAMAMSLGHIVMKQSNVRQLLLAISHAETEGSVSNIYFTTSSKFMVKKK